MFLFIFRGHCSYDLEGENAVATNRKLMGATDPKKLSLTQLERNMDYL